jgi:hypothetical protein
MKRRVLLIAVYLICCIIIHSCKKQSSDTTTTTSCPVNGTTVNIGGSTGKAYFIALGGSSSTNTYDYLYFDNTDLNFYVYETVNGFNSNGSFITDVGQESCLNFSYSTPSASLVAYKKGEGYAGVFKDGHTIKFFTISYNGGIALISYIYQ